MNDAAAIAHRRVRSEFDARPLWLLVGLMVAALWAVGSLSTWATLTVAGLAMGMIVFIIASGLTLVFGLMDVLNFGHGVFIALGAFVATTVMASPMGLMAWASAVWAKAKLAWFASLLFWLAWVWAACCASHKVDKAWA